MAASGGSRRWWASVRVALLVAIAMAALFVFAAPVSAATGFSGTVTDEVTTNPIGDAQVTALYYDEVDEWWYDQAYEWTALDGTYSFVGLPSDTYRAWFYAVDYEDEYWDDVDDVTIATDITANSTNVDAALTPLPAAITGTVTDEDTGEPLWDAEVIAWYYDSFEDTWYEWEWAYPDEAGKYAFYNLDPDTYRVSFSASGYAREFYSNQPTIDTGWDVVWNGTDTVGSVDAALAPLPVAITGTITDENTGDPLPSADVNAYSYDSGLGEWFSDAWTSSRDDGTYAFRLPPGTYRVGAVSYGYVDKFWDGASTVDAADDIVFNGVATQTGKDLALAPMPPSIAGTVTDADTSAPLYDATVTLYRSDGMGGWDEWNTQWTNGAGEYEFFGLEAGTYRVGFDQYDYILEWWNNKTSLASATDIAYDGSTPKTGIDAALAPIPVAITGTVTNEVTGDAVPGTGVTAYESDGKGGWLETGYTQTGLCGAYELRLMPGTYRVGFDRWDFVPEYFNNVATLNAATDIVFASTVQSGKNAALTPVPFTVTGTVTDSSSTDPLANAWVSVYQWNSDWNEWDHVTATSTAADGTYKLRLAPGTYRIGFSADKHADEYWNNATAIGDGTDVAVVGTTPVNGINAALAPLKVGITGKVTEEGSGDPLEGAYVSAMVYNATDMWWEEVASADSDAAGDYSLYLPAGTYRVGFWKDGFVEQFWNNAPDADTADDIVFNGTTAATGKNAALVAVPASISGTITEQGSGDPIPFADASAYVYDSWSDSWDTVDWAWGDANGDYAFYGLDPDTYRIGFSAYSYVDEYYDDAADVDTATDVVFSGAPVTGIDGALTPAQPAITGTLTSENGCPISDAYIEVYEWSADWGWDSVGWGFTDDTGQYKVYGLPNGTYRLGFYAENHVAEYWDNKASVEAAADIVYSGTTLTGKNAVMAVEPNSVTGQVTAASSGTPLGGISVYSWWFDGVEWSILDGTSTCANGKYVLGQIPCGKTKIEFRDTSGTYPGEWYNDKATRDLANWVTMTKGAIVNGIDAALGSGTPVHTVTATIDSVTPNPADFGQTITFTGSGVDSSGHGITAYEWKEGATVLSTAASFTKNNFAVGAHDVSFRVKCSTGTWSLPVNVSVTVNPSATDTTLAIINSVTPNPSKAGQTVTFTGSGVDSQGHAITSYEWKMGTDVLSTSASFTKSDLAVGSWSIVLRVQCSEGVWYGPTVTNVTVNEAGPTTAERVNGATRFETAVKLSQESFASGSVANIVVASGGGFADALSASGLAGAVDSPILLVPSSGTVPAAVKSEVERIASAGATVWIVGGKAVVPDSVANQLKVGGVTTISRLAGDTRYKTSKAVADKVADVEGGAFAGVAFIASGANFPDALAASPVAWAKGYPILLTEPTKLTAATKDAITGNNITSCIIAGGPAAVSDPTKKAIDDLPGVSVERWSASDRYATAVTIAQNAKTRGWVGFGYVGVASGENFPDALAGGPVAGSNGGVMVLTQATKLPSATSSFLSANKNEIVTCQVFGGPAAVSDSVKTAINNALK